MKNRTLKLSFLLTAILILLTFSFSSCSDSLEDESFPNQKVTLKGTISLSGAIPSELVNQSLEGTYSSRAAFPTTEGCSYSVSAVCTNPSENPAETLTGTVSGNSYLIDLTIGRTYTVTATLIKDDAIIFSDDWENVEVTRENAPGLSHNFLLKENSSGNGNIALQITVPSSVKSVKALSSATDWASSSPTFTLSSTTTATLSCSAIPSGTYEVELIFYDSENDSNRIILYSCSQTINVIANMETNFWKESSSSTSPITGGSFTLTEDLIASFARTSIYVGSTNVGEASDTTGTGSPYAPLETLEKALHIIEKQNENDKDYRIWISGRIIGQNTIGTGVNSKAESITIQGLSGNSTDILDGNNVGTVLTVNTTVPVTIKNLTITGGNAENGGGVYNSGTLILKGKNTIYDNKDSNGKQSNVYLPYGTKIKIGGDISGSKIGVSMPFTDTNRPTVDAPVIFTEDYGYGTTNASKAGAVFISDNKYAIGTDSNEAAFMVSSGSFYTSQDYNFTMTCVDSLGKAATVFYPNVAKTFTVKPTVTRTETSGRPTQLYYNPTDKKLYTNEDLTLTDCDETVSWAASLYCAGTKVTDITPSDVTGGISVTIPAIPYEYTYTLKINASYLGETYDAEWDLVCANIIGTKPKPTAVGDIVFTDGSAMAYSEISTITNDQKAAAIAVIFYVGTDCSNDGSSRTLGVGLVHNKSGLAWCTSSANAHSKNITTIQCTPSDSTGSYTFTGDKNGSDNFEQLAAFSGVSDTATESKYPAFYFTKNYKDQTGSNVSGTDYESDWYLPTICELFYIWKNKSTVDAVSELCGGSKFGNSGWYWSSSQLVSAASHAYLFNLSGFWQYGDKTTTSNAQDIISSVCAIRAFD